MNIDQIKNISTLSLNSTSEKELDINDIEKLMGSYMDGSMGVSQTKEALLDLLEGLGIEPIDALKVAIPIVGRLAPSARLRPSKSMRVALALSVTPRINTTTHNTNLFIMHLSCKSMSFLESTHFMLVSPPQRVNEKLAQRRGSPVFLVGELLGSGRHWVLNTSLSCFPDGSRETAKGTGACIGVSTQTPSADTPSNYPMHAPVPVMSLRSFPI